MFLKRLNLANFRNYSRLELQFDSRPTVLVGNNAAGKSNVLEAIYLLSTTKSLRVTTEDELIKSNEGFAKIEGFVTEGNGKTELLVIINEPTEDVLFRKKVMVNGIGRRAVDFIGYLPSVIFHPSDINMVTGSPALRRWHLDLGLAQIDSNYKKALTLYEQFLAARNKVLKRIREGQGKNDELDFWTNELVKNGQVILEKRKAFFEFINRLKTALGNFKFEYRQSEISLEKLTETNGREVSAAATLIGPHRDDFLVILNDVKNPPRMRDSDELRDSSLVAKQSLPISNARGQVDRQGRDLAHFGSRGEQRTATLAFKLAQLEYMAKILGKRPILLLDDVFSELDAQHRAHVVEIVTKQQTVIATVELENIPQSFLDSARILRVEDGRILGI